MSEDLPLLYLQRLQGLSAIAYYTMRLMPFIHARRLVARAAAWYIGPGAARGLHAELTDAEAALLTTLRHDGLGHLLPPPLSPSQLDDVNKYLHNLQLHGKKGRRFHLWDPDPVETGGSFSLADTLRCPHLLTAFNSPAILRVVQEYLGCRPTVSGLRIDWQRAGSAMQTDVQRFHRDYDDWQFIKLFVYLQEIDETNGPHEFVAGSHRRSGRFRASPYSNDELLREYGPASLVRVCGKRGTSFMADTWGIHRAGVPTSGSRLLLQVQYSIFPIPVFAYQPQSVALPRELDRYVNRLLIR